MLRRRLLGGEEYKVVDLGLPSGTLWGTGNIVQNGSKYEIGEEWEYGAYFSWGNIDPHFSTNGSTFDDNYDWGTSVDDNPYQNTSGHSIECTENTDGPSYLPDSGHDAARELLRHKWRVPTRADFRELYNNCTYAWATINGVFGLKFTSNITGYTDKYVFFPASGRGSGTTLYSRGSGCYYWTSSNYGSDYGYAAMAWKNYYGGSQVYFNNADYMDIKKYYGCTIRPVVGKGALSTPIIDYEGKRSYDGTHFYPTKIITLIPPSAATSTYYTLNGSTPSSSNGQLYQGPFSIDYTHYNVKAISYDENGNASEVAEKSFYYTVPTPKIDVADADNEALVTIYTQPSYQSLRFIYTTDPDYSEQDLKRYGTTYDGPFYVDVDCEVKAIAYDSISHTYSTMVSEDIVIDDLSTDYDDTPVDPDAGLYVDLGLPSGTKWAKYNVGASSETAYGNYFMYGKGSTSFSASDSAYTGMENPLNSNVDTATVMWGSKWRTPDRSDVQELINNTTFTWQENFNGSGVNGAKLTAANGNYIFIPAGGLYTPAGGKISAMYGGYIWTSTPYSSSDAYYATFSNSYQGCINYTARTIGYSIRPVYNG